MQMSQTGYELEISNILLIWSFPNFDFYKGSVYQKVKVQQDIDVQKRDDFWSKTEVYYN